MLSTAMVNLSNIFLSFWLRLFFHPTFQLTIKFLELSDFVGVLQFLDFFEILWWIKMKLIRIWNVVVLDDVTKDSQKVGSRAT